MDMMSYSKANSAERKAKDAERKAEEARSLATKAHREIGEMRADITELKKLVQAFQDTVNARLDQMEEALVDPKSDAAEELAQKHGGTQGRAGRLKKIEKYGPGGAR